MSLAMTDSTEIKPIFKSKPVGNGITEHELIDIKMKVKDRRTLSQRVPVILKTTHHLPKKDTDAVGWTQMDAEGQRIHTVKTKVANVETRAKNAATVKVGFARYFSTIENNTNGVLERMKKVHSIVGHEAHQKKLLGWAMEANNQHLKKKGTTYDTTWTKQPHHGTKEGQGGCIQLGGIARKNDDDVRAANQLIAQNASFLVKQAISEFQETEKYTGVREKRYYSEATMAVGDEDNELVSNIQWNYCRAGTELGDALVMVGGIHVDGNDDKLYFTVLQFLDNLHRDWYPGRFLITSAKLMCTAARGSALVFTGNYPHFALAMGPYPKHLRLNSPLRYRNPIAVQRPILGPEYPPDRIVPVVYPKHVFMQSTKSWLRPEIFSETTLNCFGTKRNMQEWLVRDFIRTQSERALFVLGVDKINSKFAWKDENGTTQYPRRERPRRAVDSCTMSAQLGIDLEKAVGFFSVGTQFPNAYKPTELRGSDKVGIIDWTHTDYQVSFHHLIDELPANHDWRNPVVVRSMSFFAARSMRDKLTGRATDKQNVRGARLTLARYGPVDGHDEHDEDGEEDGRYAVNDGRARKRRRME